MRVDYVATLQKCECLMFHAGPQKSNRNQGALCWTSIFGSKILIMHAGTARPLRNAESENPPNCTHTTHDARGALACRCHSHTNNKLSIMTPF